MKRFGPLTAEVMRALGRPRSAAASHALATASYGKYRPRSRTARASAWKEPAVVDVGSTVSDRHPAAPDATRRRGRSRGERTPSVDHDAAGAAKVEDPLAPAVPAQVLLDLRAHGAERGVPRRPAVEVRGDVEAALRLDGTDDLAGVSRERRAGDLLGDLPLPREEPEVAAALDRRGVLGEGPRELGEILPGVGPPLRLLGPAPRLLAPGEGEAREGPRIRGLEEEVSGPHPAAVVEGGPVEVPPERVGGEGGEGLLETQVPLDRDPLLLPPPVEEGGLDLRVRPPPLPAELLHLRLDPPPRLRRH